LYPATDEQQTGNDFVAGNKQHVAGNMLPWCKRGFRVAKHIEGDRVADVNYE